MDLESLVASISERLEAGVELQEDPNLELKSQWPHGSEKEQIWQVSDLVAALANDAHLPGIRGIVYGPASEIGRPEWLTDESVLRPKLLRHFEGGVVPRVELIRRELPDGRMVDILMIVDRSETPYVTRFPIGGEWTVRVRTNTARRTATRAELVALAGAKGRSAAPVRKLDLRLSKEKSMVTLNVTNVGTVTCREVLARLPEDGGTQWIEGNSHSFQLSDLRPGQKDGCKFFASWNESRRFEIQVEAIAEDGEPLEEYVLYSSELL